MSVDSALYKVVKTNRDYAVIYQNISLIKNFIKHKKLDKALSLILDKSSGEILDLYKYDKWVAWYNLGNIYLEKGDIKNALQSYRTSNNYKNCTNTEWAIGNCYSDLGRTKLAERFFKKALAKSNNDSKLLYNLANALFDQKRYGEAISVYNKVINIKSIPSYLFKRANKNISNARYNLLH